MMIRHVIWLTLQWRRRVNSAGDGATTLRRRRRDLGADKHEALHEEMLRRRPIIWAPRAMMPFCDAI